MPGMEISIGLRPKKKKKAGGGLADAAFADYMKERKGGNPGNPGPEGEKEDEGEEVDGAQAAAEEAAEAFFAAGKAEDWPGAVKAYKALKAACEEFGDTYEEEEEPEED